MVSAEHAEVDPPVHQAALAALLVSRQYLKIGIVRYRHAILHDSSTERRILIRASLAELYLLHLMELAVSGQMPR